MMTVVKVIYIHLIYSVHPIIYCIIIVIYITLCYEYITEFTDYSINSLSSRKCGFISLHKGIGSTDSSVLSILGDLGCSLTTPLFFIATGLPGRRDESVADQTIPPDILFSYLFDHTHSLTN